LEAPPLQDKKNNANLAFVFHKENERLFQEWLWRKHLLEQMKKGLSKIGNNVLFDFHITAIVHMERA